MAWRLPRFNQWCQVWRPNDSGHATLRGYSLCQLRGPTSHVDNTNAGLFEVLFPKWSDIVGFSFSGGHNGDLIMMSGFLARHYAQIVLVADKGAGFPNEYRLATCMWRPTTTVIPPLEVMTPCSDPTQLPPDGYLPLPVLSPSAWSFSTPL